MALRTGGNLACGFSALPHVRAHMHTHARTRQGGGPRPGDRRVRRIITWTDSDGVQQTREIILTDKTGAPLLGMTSLQHAHTRTHMRARTHTHTHAHTHTCTYTHIHTHLR